MPENKRMIPQDDRWVQVVLDVHQPAEVDCFEGWCQEQAIDISTLRNEGCGCCVEIYIFQAPMPAAKVLEEKLNQAGGSLSFLKEDSEWL